MIDGTITWTLRHEISRESVSAKLDKSKAGDSKHEPSLDAAEAAQRPARSALRASAHPAR